MLTAAMTRKHARPWRQLAATIREDGKRYLPPPAAARGPGAWGYIRVSREEQVQSGLTRFGIDSPIHSLQQGVAYGDTTEEEGDARDRSSHVQ